MPPITDQELASQIKAKVAELNELEHQAKSQGLTVSYDVDMFGYEEQTLERKHKLTAHIRRITAL